MKKILTLLIIALTAVSSHGKIKVKQTLNIRITGVPVDEQGRLNSAYPVSTDGFIDMWEVGRIKAIGLTSAELAATIAAKFKAAQIYSNPVFQVINTDELSEIEREKEREIAKKLRETEREIAEEARKKEFIQDTQTFTVGGTVNRTGIQQWKEGMTLYAAVQAAGGPTTFGAINRVKLYRNDQVYTYNLKNDSHKGVKIYPNDIVDVPAKNAIGR